MSNMMIQKSVYHRYMRGKLDYTRKGVKRKFVCQELPRRLTHDINKEVFPDRVTFLIEYEALISPPITTSLHVCNDQTAVTEYFLSMILRKTTTICVHKVSVSRVQQTSPGSNELQRQEENRARKVTSECHMKLQSSFRECKK